MAEDTATRLTLDAMIAQRAEAARSRSLNHRGITQMPGLARTRLRGRGLDFDEMRPYAEGDDVRHIDWNVTARTGRPHTRLYREERERAVTVAVDFRPPMYTGSARLKAVVAGEVAAALLWRVTANQDRAGAIVFDDGEIAVSRPGLRERGALEALAEIDRVFARGRRAMNGAPVRTERDLASVIAVINRLGRNGGMVVLVSGCDNSGDDLDTQLAIAGRRQRLAVLRLADPLELRAPPVGAYAYNAGGKSRFARVGSADISRLQQDLNVRNEALATRFEQNGVPYVSMPSDRPIEHAWALLAERGVV